MKVMMAITAITVAARTPQLAGAALAPRIAHAVARPHQPR